MFRQATLVVMFSAALMACGLGPLGADPSQPVTFTVTASAEAFSDRQPVTVRVYDAEQLAIADETSGCSVSRDVATGEERITCPPGVTYRPTTPEETSVPSSQLAQGVIIRSTTVSVGERYRVTLGGLAADDCNSAGAIAEGVASSPTIELKDLEIAQTLIGCP